jgi:hypothetical protein
MGRVADGLENAAGAHEVLDEGLDVEFQQVVVALRVADAGDGAFVTHHGSRWHAPG